MSAAAVEASSGAPVAPTRLTVERLCAWCGPALTVVFAIGFIWLIGWLPAPSPSLTPTEVAAMYAENRWASSPAASCCR